MGVVRFELRFLNPLDHNTNMQRLDFVVHRSDHTHARLHPHGHRLKSTGRKEAAPVYGRLEHWVLNPDLPWVLSDDGMSPPVVPSDQVRQNDSAVSPVAHIDAVAAAVASGSNPTFYPTTRTGDKGPPPQKKGRGSGASSSDGGATASSAPLPAQGVVTAESAMIAVPQQDVLGLRDAAIFLEQLRIDWLELQLWI